MVNSQINSEDTESDQCLEQTLDQTTKDESKQIKLVRVDKNIDQIVSICNELFVNLSVDESDIEIKEFETGMISSIFRITFKHSFEKQWSKDANVDRTIVHQEDRELFESGSMVIKFYPPNEDDALFDVLASNINSVVAGMAYDQQIGPKVLLVKKDVLVIEFIKGRPSIADDDNNANFCRSFAYKLARFHSMQVPNRRSNYQSGILTVCDYWITQTVIDQIYQADGVIGKVLLKNNCPHLLSCNYRDELQFVKNAILSANFPIVYSHGDINHSNIMVVKEELEDGSTVEDVRLIDFDFSGYLYRGRDLGSYFNECTQETDIAVIDDWQMLQFIDHYIEECCQIYGETFRENPRNSRENLLREGKIFVLFAFLFDTNSDLWFSSINRDKSEEFIIFADKRFGRYLRAKKQFQQEQSLPDGFN